MRRSSSRNFRKEATSFLLDTEGEGSHNNWAISYGDMVTLLLCFFVLFFGSRSHTKIRLLEKSLLQQATRAGSPSASPGASPTLGESSTVQMTSSGSGGLGAGSGKGIGAGTGPGKGIGTGTGTGTGTGIGTGIGTGTGTGTGTGNGGILARAWKTLSNLETSKVQRENSDLVVEFPGISFFDFRKTELTPAGMRQLEHFASVFKDYQNDLKLVVIGYTDGVRVVKRKSHGYKDNLELSALRGVAAVRYLHGLGVSLDHMRVGGEGEWKGLAREPATEDKPNAAARRIVLVVQTVGGDSK